jgi:hypothetical protein
MAKTARNQAIRLSHLELPSSPERAPLQIPLRAADAKRSVENILKWNSYLPADCVRTMVRMGWDYTT